MVTIQIVRFFLKIEEVKTFDERNNIEENSKKSFIIKEIVM